MMVHFRNVFRRLIKVVMILLFIAITSICYGQENYEIEQIQFKNQDVTLAGELISPEGDGPFPAIVFLHGSGPHTREGFRSYAVKFAEIGFASIFYDKRGTGSSTGSWITSSLDDLANDAVEAVSLLKNDNRINPDLIGFWAISQGGWIGPLAARKSGCISFGIIISGGGASPKESEIFTYQNILNNTNLKESDKEAAIALVYHYFYYLKTGDGYTELNTKIDESKEKDWYKYIRLDRILPSEKNRPNWEWVAAYDPSFDIKRIDFPLLLMFGEKDASHPTELSVSKWEEFLRPSVQEKTLIKIFPEAGHGIRMRHLEGKPFAEGYENTMIRWLNATLFE